MTYKGAVEYVNFYIDGSSAKKIAPVRHKRRAVLPKPRKHKRKVVYIDPFVIMGSVVAICLLVVMFMGLSVLREERMQTETMYSYVEYLEKENTELTTRYEAGYDLEEVERTALALGMVPESEVPHTVVQIPAETPEEQPQKVTLLARIAALLSDMGA